MIKQSKIKINISYRNITHYLKLGYNAMLNSDLEIDTIHLPSVSHVKIDVICEICNIENKIMYCKYLNNKERCGFYGCKKCSRQKAALTSISKYGVDNYSKTDEFKKRVEETNLSKYGYKTNLISPEYKESFKKILKDKYGTENWFEIRNGMNANKYKFVFNESIYKLITDDVFYSESVYDNNILNTKYLLYRNECRRLSNKNLNVLFNEWDGKDYYDKEDISSYFNLDHNDLNYPTIDHKISIYYGFKNNIDKSIISSLENLCITKRSINSKKRDLTEEEFNKNPHL